MKINKDGNWKCTHQQGKEIALKLKRSTKLFMWLHYEINLGMID